MPCMSGAAGNWGAKAAPLPARSTARASEAPEKGACIDPHGHGAGKKINGKKRHVMVDTQGLPMRAVVHPANVQGRGGGAPPVSTPFGPYPFLRKLFAGGGYQGPRFEQAVARVLAPVNVEAVKRPGTAKGFAVLPRAGGWWGAPSPGSTVAAARPRTSGTEAEPLSLSSNPRPFASRHEGSVTHNELCGRTLRIPSILRHVRYVCPNKISTGLVNDRRRNS